MLSPLWTTVSSSQTHIVVEQQKCCSIIIAIIIYMTVCACSIKYAAVTEFISAAYVSGNLNCIHLYYIYAAGV